MRNWPIKIISLAAAILLFFFNNISRLEERFFSVPLTLRLNDNYVPASPYPNNIRVRLRGEEEAIFTILEEDIEAYADFSRFDREGEFKAPIEVEKKGSALDIEPLEIKVEPLEVTLILEEKLIKSAEVAPTLTGYLPTGYELGQYFLTPSYVEIEGPRSVVESLDSIMTEEIDLSGKTEDFSVRVRLVKPDPFIRIPGGEVVEFSALVEESIVLKTFEELGIITLDLLSELRPAEPLPSGSIRVQGTQTLLESVTGEDIRLTVDCSSITVPGTYTLSVRPDVPMGFLILRYEPTELQIRFVYEEAE